MQRNKSGNSIVSFSWGEQSRRSVSPNRVHCQFVPKSLLPVCANRVHRQFVSKSILPVCAKEYTASLCQRVYCQFVPKGILPVCAKEYNASLFVEKSTLSVCAKEYTASLCHACTYTVSLCQRVYASFWPRIYSVCAKEYTARMWPKVYCQFVPKSLLPVCSQKYTNCQFVSQSICQFVDNSTLSVCAKEYTASLCHPCTYSVSLCQRVYCQFVAKSILSVSLCQKNNATLFVDKSTLSICGQNECNESFLKRVYCHFVTKSLLQGCFKELLSMCGIEYTSFVNVSLCRQRVSSSVAQHI
jgi:hypothetical protein